MQPPSHGTPSTAKSYFLSSSLSLTAGQLNLSPSSSNCIPGKCVFTLDIRSGDMDILKTILKKVEMCAKEQEKNGIAVEVKTLSYRDPVLMDQRLRSDIEKSCQELSLSYRYLDSGAGHDSMIFAKRWPTAMIFLPNRNGICHNPAECIDYNAMKNGTEVLYHTIRHLDQSQ